MFEYLFPPFIFITTCFLLIISIKWSYPMNYWGGLIGAGLLTYFLYTLNLPVIVLGLFFLSELGLLIFLLIKWKEDLNPKILSILYVASILIVFFVFKGIYSDDKEMKSHFNEVEMKEANYKRRYNFNVDSFLSNSFDLKIDAEMEPSPPVIIYKAENYKLEFDIESNEELESTLKSFDKDSIKTIVLLKNSTIDVGTYENSGTIAQQIETTIYFIDRYTRKAINSVTVLGSEPPDQVRYKITAPKTVVGSEPYASQIVDAIKSKFK